MAIVGLRHASLAGNLALYDTVVGADDDAVVGAAVVGAGGVGSFLEAARGNYVAAVAGGGAAAAVGVGADAAAACAAAASACYYANHASGLCYSGAWKPQAWWWQLEQVCR